MIYLMSIADLIMDGLPLAGIAMVGWNVKIRIEEWRRLIECQQDPGQGREL